MKNKLPFAFLCAVSLSAHAMDIFDGSKLLIPNVFLGGTLYSDVQVTVGKVLSIEGGTANNIYDRYNPANNQLTIPSVKVGNVTYTNVTIEVGSVISAGGFSTPIPSGFTNTSAVVAVENALGALHSTGVVPFDLNGDGVTDLIFTPSTLNTGPDKKAFSVLNTGNAFTHQTNGAWNKSIATGFVKDWTITDLNADGLVDLAWIDHGLELPANLGGFENGLNASLLSGGNGQYSYKSISATKAFNHGLTLASPNVSGSAKELIVADFQVKLKKYTLNSQGNFTSSDLSLGNEYGYSPPGAVAAVTLKNKSTVLVAASYTRPNPQWDPNGFVMVYAYDGSNIAKIDKLEFPTSWKNDNLGAFAIVSGDFRGCGCDDFLVLGETVDLNNYKRDVIYFQQVDGKFVDATSKYLADVQGLINQPDKIVPIDVNQDGFVDLVGFSYKVGSYVNGAGLFLSDGTGKFISQKFGPDSLSNVANYPIFSTRSDGSWKTLIGLFGVSTPGTTSLSLKSWYVNQ